MGASLKNLSRKVKNKGFVGPKYNGFMGKLRFILQHFITHKENIYYFDRSFENGLSQRETHGLTIRCISSYYDAIPYVNIFENSYYQGFTSGWESCFSWGEELILAFFEDRPVAFCWFQKGGTAGGNYCLPYFKGDYRSFRAGVLPAERGRNFQALMNHAVTNYLLRERSANRIYAEVFIDNVPSCKAYEKTGYKIVGIIRVWSLFSRAKPFIRWDRFFPKTSS